MFRLARLPLLMICLLCACTEEDSGLDSPLAAGKVTAADPDKDVTGVSASSDSPGVISVSWTAPVKEPTDYRVRWSKADKSANGSAFPTATSHSFSGMEEGTEYFVRVRARYGDEKPGPWTGKHFVTVAATPATPEPEPPKETRQPDELAPPTMTFVEAPADGEAVEEEEEEPTSARSTHIPEDEGFRLEFGDACDPAEKPIVLQYDHGDHEHSYADGCVHDHDNISGDGHTHPGGDDGKVRHEHRARRVLKHTHVRPGGHTHPSYDGVHSLSFVHGDHAHNADGTASGYADHDHTNASVEHTHDLNVPESLHTHSGGSIEDDDIEDGQYDGATVDYAVKDHDPNEYFTGGDYETSAGGSHGHDQEDCSSTGSDTYESDHFHDGGSSHSHPRGSYGVDWCNYRQQVFCNQYDEWFCY